MPEKTIFKKIIDKEIPAEILYEDEHFWRLMMLPLRLPFMCL